MARVKICGITSQESLDAAAEADWVGFNFYPPSPRFVTPARAAALEGGPVRVGLFVAPTDDEIEAALALASIDILQIYADLPRIRAVRARFARPVWRAVGVAAAQDLPTSSDEVDGFVIEAKAPPDAELPAGNGRPFEWSVLDGWTSPLPWLLAGGLDPENVRAAIAASQAPAVDVSSGVERQRGVKDPDLIRLFIAEARAA
ncbi:MAG: phosphoribosylanthranilate isomerase [Acetobacteraceae bacterium]|nr:phosphoribosylanthranilate isomerase [Acetobacteraceae bacterium]